MKKNIMTIGVISVIGIIALGASFIFKGKESGQEGEILGLVPTIGTISEIEGEVLVRQAGMRTFLVAEDGLIVNVNGEVATSFNGKAKLTFPDGSWMRMGPNTIIKLYHAYQDKDGNKLRVGLALGQVWVVLNGGALSVETASGVASVRGSYMSVQSIQGVQPTESNQDTNVTNPGVTDLYSESMDTSEAKDAMLQAIQTLSALMEKEAETTKNIICKIKGCAEVECLEGECNVDNEGGESDLTAGQKSFLLGLTTPPLVGEMVQADYDDWEIIEPEAEKILPIVMESIETRNSQQPKERQDIDADGVPDEDDDCILRGDVGWGVDRNGCPILPEGDSDGDEIPNDEDSCPHYGLGSKWAIDEEGCPILPPDSDQDGYPDAIDGCPVSGDQGYGLNSHGCPIPPPDEDTDGDGLINAEDECPLVGDWGFGVNDNGCPVNLPDSDGDGYPDWADTCPEDDQGSIYLWGVDEWGCADTPFNGILGEYPKEGDHDHDGVVNAIDQDCTPYKEECEKTGWETYEGSGTFIGGVSCTSDAFPGHWEQMASVTFCASGTNDQDPPDYDGDGIPDSLDDCPWMIIYDWEGIELLPNGCPSIDSDGDGLDNLKDACPFLGDQGLGVGPDGCPNEDSDSDGIFDWIDACPFDGDDGFGLDRYGCPIHDRDGDGIIDGLDQCPDDGDQGNGVDRLGCPNPVDLDRDRDGISDRDDACPDEGDEGYGISRTGCPNPPTDQDRDGVFDNDDACPSQGDQGYGVDSRGCPNPPTDRDGDGVPDNEDSCPSSGDEGNGVDRKGCPNPPPDRDDDEKCTDRAGNPIRCP